MTDEQKLSLAIQREVGANDMRTLALNSLRFKTLLGCSNIKTLGKDEAAHVESEIQRIDGYIIASIPDDSFHQPLSHTDV